MGYFSASDVACKIRRDGVEVCPGRPDCAAANYRWAPLTEIMQAYADAEVEEYERMLND